MTRPVILISNDDGIHAPGIRALWAALHKADLWDLILVAPSTERSGAGVSITCDRPIHIQSVEWPDQTAAWSVDGTPADCVKLGERIILQKKPDLVVSGINAGSNAGRNVLHSGTVGAVIEAAFRGIPGVAFSCENNSNPNFDAAQEFVAPIVQYVLAHPLPSGVILNVNIPGVNDILGVRWTNQGKGRWIETPYLHLNTRSGPTYFLGGMPEERDDEEGDVAWMRKGYVAAVPIYVNDLTHEASMERCESFEDFYTLALR